MTTFDRDLLLKRALSVPEDVHAPAGLGDDIMRAVAGTRQRRTLAGRLGLGRVAWLPSMSPQLAGLVLLALLATLVLVTILAHPAGPTHRLSMYHGGADRTGIMTGPGPGDHPVVVWDVARPGPLGFTTMPLVEDGRVFVADASGAVAALRATDGGTIWETDVGSRVRGTPALVGTLIVVGTDAGDVVALRTADGTLAWHSHVSTAAISASLLTDAGRVYAGGEDGELYVLDGQTGSRLWAVGVGGPITRGPALDGGVLYVGASGGRFSAIDAQAGTVRWQVELGPGEIGTPAVGGGLVYVGRGLQASTGPHDLVALSLSDGALRWEFAAPDGRQVHAGALAAGTMFAVSDDGSLFALDAATGRERWTASTGGVLGTLASYVDGVVYVGSGDRTVRAFDATSGRQLWQVAVAGVPTEQAVVDGRLFLGTSLGRALAIGDPASASSVTPATPVLSPSTSP